MEEELFPLASLNGQKPKGEKLFLKRGMYINFSVSEKQQSCLPVNAYPSIT